jgi:hypothetical protein
MSQTGIGVMLGYLGGNKETVDTIKASLNKIIEKVWLDEEKDKLFFKFEDNTGMVIWDDGQSCCEWRYMRTDDTLSEFSGAKLLGLELKDAPDQEDEYGEVHEIQFLDVKTDKGIFQIATHNEHNGYYGGFNVVARPYFPK